MMCFPLKIIHLDVPLLNTSTFFIIVSCCCLYLCVDYFFFGHLGTFGFDVVDTEFLTYGDVDGFYDGSRRLRA